MEPHLHLTTPSRRYPFRVRAQGVAMLPLGEQQEKDVRRSKRDGGLNSHEGKCNLD